MPWRPLLYPYESDEHNNFEEIITSKVESVQPVSKLSFQKQGFICVTNNTSKLILKGM